ncbi:MAG TPA: helix-turn-helix domain-containing protein [Bacteroidia bacterium]
MRYYIKFMVSLRCKNLVKEELNRIGIDFAIIELGMFELPQKLSDSQIKSLKANLAFSGLELLEDKKAILIEKIKNAIVEMIHFEVDLPKQNYSDYLSEKLGYDYTYLSNIFSMVNGMTIQHFIIINKIEKIKELLLYNELSLSEISFQLHYSSAAHMSNQFKKITGLTPSYFKQLKKTRLMNLENM